MILVRCSTCWAGRIAPFTPRPELAALSAGNANQPKSWGGKWLPVWLLPPFNNPRHVQRWRISTELATEHGFCVGCYKGNLYHISRFVSPKRSFSSQNKNKKNPTAARCSEDAKTYIICLTLIFKLMFLVPVIEANISILLYSLYIISFTILSWRFSSAVYFSPSSGMWGFQMKTLNIYVTFFFFNDFCSDHYDMQP